MPKESLQKEGTDIEYARMCGLNDKKIEAMNGMGSLLPRASIYKFGKKKNTPKKIEETVKRYAEVFKTTTKNFVKALNNPGELLDKANKDLAILTRTAIKKDLDIQEALAKSGTSEIIGLTRVRLKGAGSGRSMVRPASPKARSISPKVAIGTTQTSAPPPQHPDSSI